MARTKVLMSFWSERYLGKCESRDRRGTREALLWVDHRWVHRVGGFEPDCARALRSSPQSVHKQMDDTVNVNSLQQDGVNAEAISTKIRWENLA